MTRRDLPAAAVGIRFPSTLTRARGRTHHDRQPANPACRNAERQTWPRAFQARARRGAGAEGRRRAGAGALHLAGCGQPGLDAGRHLSLRGGGQHGDGRRRRGRSRRVEGARVCQGRPRVRRHRLAGFCRAPRKAGDQDPADRAADLSPERVWHRGADRLLRLAECRPAQCRRNCCRLGCGRLGGFDRRADRQVERLPRRRHRRRHRQMQLAEERARLRCRRRLQGRAGVQGAEGSGAQRHRRLLRQCRRRYPRSLPVPDEQPRPHRLLRRHLAIRRRAASRPDRAACRA